MTRSMYDGKLDGQPYLKEKGDVQVRGPGRR